MLSQVLRTYFSSILFYNASLNSRGFHLYNVTGQTAALQTSYWVTTQTPTGVRYSKAVNTKVRCQPSCLYKVDIFMFAREIRRVVPHQSHLSVVYWNLFFVRVTKYYEKLRRRKACNKRSREIATLVRLSFRSTKNGLFRFLFLPSCLPIFISFPLVPISLQNCLSLPSTPNNVTFFLLLLLRNHGPYVLFEVVRWPN